MDKDNPEFVNLFDFLLAMGAVVGGNKSLRCHETSSHFNNDCDKPRERFLKNGVRFE